LFSFRWLIAAVSIAQEDPVLLTPEDSNQKPYVAILKVCVRIRDQNQTLPNKLRICLVS
jgi:hypothetical protein